MSAEHTPSSERLAALKREHVACDCLWPEIERLVEQHAAYKTALERSRICRRTTPWTNCCRKSASHGRRLMPEPHKEPPERISILFCPICGRDDRFARFGKSYHSTGGERCSGQPIQLIYLLEKR